jgi:hypothetical protein
MLKKSIGLLCLVFFLASNAFSQLMPNGDFEGPPFDWRGLQGGIMSLTTTQKVDLAGGKTDSLKAFAGNWYAFVKNSSTKGGLWQKYPMTQRPASFRLAYSYVPQGDGDRGGVIIHFTKFNTTTQLRDTILADTLIFNAEQFPWKETGIDLVNSYRGAESPDSVFVLFVPSVFNTINVGSMLAVDNVGFSEYTLGTEDVQMSFAATVSPNPASSTITVSIDKSSNAKWDIDLMDAMGKKVDTSRTNIQRGIVQSTEFDVAELPRGVYYIRMGNGDMVQTKKVVLVTGSD